MPEFRQYLSPTLKFTGNVYAMREARYRLPQPADQSTVEAPLIECQTLWRLRSSAS